jgi:hypothetical protein
LLQVLVAGIVPADGTGAANWANGDFGKSPFGQVSILWAAFQTRTACPVNHMAMRILRTIGVVLELALYLSTL